MKKKSLARLFKLVYLKLFRIHDTPQKIAQGLGLGVFLGILPGAGPLAALFLAWALRLNRASALLGSLLTNTWISFVTFLLSIKIGSAVMGLKWQEIYTEITLFFKNFQWINLFKLSVIKIILPVLLGYLIIGLSLAILAYLMALIILRRLKRCK